MRAGATMCWLWVSLVNRYCVTWVDNFFCPRYVYTPGMMGNASLNCTVMAVLHVPNLYVPLPILHSVHGQL